MWACQCLGQDLFKTTQAKDKLTFNYTPQSPFSSVVRLIESLIHSEKTENMMWISAQDSSAGLETMGCSL